jgi:cytochrome c oxidase assembly protein subunit 15
MPEITPRVSAAVSWLGVLLLLLLLVIVGGGFVRLTGSSVTLSGWPLDGGRLLPPFGAGAWQERYREYLNQPSGNHFNFAEFQWRFWLAFSHRVTAILAVVVACVAALNLWREAEWRRLAWLPLLGLVALLVVQSLIGGLVATGHLTGSTVWVHLGLAPWVLVCVLWPLLVALHRRAERPVIAGARWWAVRCNDAALLALWLQMVLGGLVAASKDHGFSSSWPLMQGALVPAWESEASWWRDPMFVQWLHRWSAWVTAFLVIFSAYVAQRPGRLVWLVRRACGDVPPGLGARGSLAADASISLVLVQCGLGIATVLLGAPAFVAAAHLLAAMLLWCILWLVRFGLYYEFGASRSSLANQPATAANPADAAARPGSPGLGTRNDSCDN